MPANSGTERRKWHFKGGGGVQKQAEKKAEHVF
jgi:hypothetical protein